MVFYRTLSHVVQYGIDWTMHSTNRISPLTCSCQIDPPKKENKHLVRNENCWCAAGDVLFMIPACMGDGLARRQDQNQALTKGKPLRLAVVAYCLLWSTAFSLHTTSYGIVLTAEFEWHRTIHCLDSQPTSQVRMRHLAHDED